MMIIIMIILNITHPANTESTPHIYNISFKTEINKNGVDLNVQAKLSSYSFLLARYTQKR